MISLLTKKTKIVATLGPATASPEILEKLLTNGANVIDSTSLMENKKYTKKV